jgi:hypothetical protein
MQRTYLELELAKSLLLVVNFLGAQQLALLLPSGRRASHRLEFRFVAEESRLRLHCSLHRGCCGRVKCGTVDAGAKGVQLALRAEGLERGREAGGFSLAKVDVQHATWECRPRRCVQ